MTEKFFATVLYEDQQGPRNRFGLHAFIMRCVCDDVPNEDMYKILARVEDRQMKGDSKLVKAVQRDLPKIARDGRPVIAVFDNDQIRRHLKLPSATDNEVCAAIKEGSQGNIHVILLKENTETILVAAQDCGAAEFCDVAELSSAIAKNLPARDIVFGKIAKKNAKHIRDCIREKVPSLRPLIDQIALLIAA